MEKERELESQPINKFNLLICETNYVILIASPPKLSVNFKTLDP